MDLVLTSSRTEISRLASGVATACGLDIIVLLDPAVCLSTVGGRITLAVHLDVAVVEKTRGLLTATGL